MAPRILFAILFLYLTATANADPNTDLLPRTVGILLRFDHPTTPGFINTLRQQVEQFFRPAKLNFQWELDNHKVGVYHRVVIVQMRGTCRSTHVNDFMNVELLKGVPLGWTFVNDGEVLPHSVIDCDQIARTVSQLKSRASNRSVLTSVYFRLTSRVMAHELMHALLQTTDHDDADFTRSPLKVDELGGIPRLKPSQVMALQRIGRGSSGVSVAKK